MLSRTGVPTGPPGEAEARMPGMRFWTTRVNVWHAWGSTPLLAQTVVGPKLPAEDVEPVRNPSGLRLRPGGRVPLVTE
jgi:hypothetical protein